MMPVSGSVQIDLEFSKSSYFEDVFNDNEKWRFGRQKGTPS